MKWRIIFFVFFLGLEFTSFAQILNVEKSRIIQDSLSHFETNIVFNTTFYNRSTDADKPAKFLSLGGNANFAYYSLKHSYIALNHLSYMELNDNAFINTIYSHFRVNFMRRKKISYELFTQYQNDLRRGLDQRTLAGAGLRFVLVNTEKTSLAFGLGAMYEEEDWQHPKDDMPSKSTQIIKSTNYMAFHTSLSETAKFGLISYFQSGSGRNRLNVDSNLSFKITKNISFRTTFSAAYDAKPVVPVTKFIYKLTNGISLTF